MIRRLFSAALGICFLIPATAHADTPIDVYAITRAAYAGPSTSEWVTPYVVVPKGANLYLTNLNVWGHTMYSVLNGRNDRLFWSEEVPFGKSTIVYGVPALAAGSYAFFCINHPDMKGTLVVIDKEDSA